MYDAAKLRAIGGFGFGSNFPRTLRRGCPCQLRLMARYGGCGLILRASTTKNCLQQLLTAAWLQTMHSVLQRVFNTWDQSYLGHSGRGKLWVLGFAEQVCQTIRPSNPANYYHS